MDGLPPPEDIQFVLPVEVDENRLPVEEADQFVLLDLRLREHPLVFGREVTDLNQLSICASSFLWPRTRYMEGQPIISHQRVDPTLRVSAPRWIAPSKTNRFAPPANRSHVIPVLPHSELVDGQATASIKALRLTICQLSQNDRGSHKARVRHPKRTIAYFNHNREQESCARRFGWFDCMRYSPIRETARYDQRMHPHSVCPSLRTSKSIKIEWERRAGHSTVIQWGRL